MRSQAESAGRGQYLTLHAGGSEYVISVGRVRQIERYVVRATPSASATTAWIRGVIGVQGRPIPIVDLAAKLERVPMTSTPTSCVVVVDVRLRGEPIVVGILADEVSQVIELGPQDMAPPPSLGSRIDLGYLQGLARIGDRLALMLDVDHVLSADEALAVAAAVDEAAPAFAEAGEAGSRQAGPARAISDDNQVVSQPS